MESKIERIIIISKSSTDSGNFSTISRISKNIQSLNNRIIIKLFKVSNPLEKEKELEDIINQWKPDLIFGLNLLQCLFLSNIKLNTAMVIILGGTDINIEMNEEERSKSFEIINKCQRIVAFSDEMKKKFHSIFPEINSGKVKIQIDVIPQGIDLTDADNYRESPENDNLLKNLNINFLFLVVGRLRSVKDPGFIVKPFMEWTLIPEYFKYHLLFVGDIEEKTEDIIAFLDDIEGVSNIHHINSLEKDRVFNLMLKSKALINCSKNEGQSTAILEAMVLGVPILARNVPGNKDLIKNNYNGLLFNNKEDLKESLTAILDNTFSKTLVVNAKNFVLENHNPKAEAYKYIDIINEIK